MLAEFISSDCVLLERLYSYAQQKKFLLWKALILFNNAMQANSNLGSKLWNIIMSTPLLNIPTAKNKSDYKVGQKYSVHRTWSPDPYAYRQGLLLSPGSSSPWKFHRSTHENELSKKRERNALYLAAGQGRWGEEGGGEFRKVVSLLKKSKQTGKCTKCTPFCGS